MFGFTIGLDIGNSYSVSVYFSFFSVISVVLWIGDLNYRISDLDVDRVKELISKKDFETLHSFDQVVATMVLYFCYLYSLYCCVFEWWYLPAACGPQLKRQIDKEAVFDGFVEGEIDFQPTYKYDTGSDNWDTR